MFISEQCVLKTFQMSKLIIKIKCFSIVKYTINIKSKNTVFIYYLVLFLSCFVKYTDCLLQFIDFISGCAFLQGDTIIIP